MYVLSIISLTVVVLDKVKKIHRIFNLVTNIL